MLLISSVKPIEIIVAASAFLIVVGVIVGHVIQKRKNKKNGVPSGCCDCACCPHCAACASLKAKEKKDVNA